MVVLGIFKYLLQNGTGEKISLEDLANRYKNEFNRTPVIVVDGIRILDPCFKNLDRGIYGGQWSEYLQRIQAFVRNLKSTGINFVFYFDGSFKEMSKFEMKLRQELEMPKTLSAFQEIRNKNYHSKPLSILPPGLPSLMRYILKYEFDCIVRTSVKDIKQEIARFAATTDECIGILANDSEYIIFETKPLLSAKDIDVENMTTNIFHRSKFIEVSRLDGLQLPLLSCLAGNSLISSNDLREFHTQLSPNYSSKDHYHIKNVVRHIKRKEWTGNEEEFSEIAAELSITEEKLREGMSYYDLATLNDMTEEDRFSLVREKCVNSSIPAPLYILLLLQKYKEGASMEDPNDNQLPSSASIYRPVRQKLYYVLHGGQSVNIEEHCVYKDNNFTEPELVISSPIEINEEIPPINEILSGDVDQELRWKLFSACLGLTIPILRLKGIEPRLVPICALLNFLIQNNDIGLEDWEVKSFIYQAIYPRTINISQLEINEISSRPVSLSGIFLRGVITIIKVIPVCGFPIPLAEAMPWKYLEGEVFHYAYNLLKNKPNTDAVIVEMCGKDEDLASWLHELYGLAVMGTHLRKLKRC